MITFLRCFFFHSCLSFHLRGVSPITIVCTALIQYMCVVKAVFHRWDMRNELLGYFNMVWIEHFTSVYYSSQNIKLTKTLCLHRYKAKYIVEVVNFIPSFSSILFAFISFLAHFQLFQFVSNHNQRTYNT